MKILQIAFQLKRRISFRVTGDKKRLQFWIFLGIIALNSLQDFGYFFQFFWTYIGTIGEAEIDNQNLVFQVGSGGQFVTVMVGQDKRSAYFYGVGIELLR